MVFFWILLSFFGSFPFIFDMNLSMSFVDAFFESVSGWTTTGATIISNLDDLSPSILIYRQLLQWLGGMGIVVLALAVLPMLGVECYKNTEVINIIRNNRKIVEEIGRAHV